MPQKTNLNVSPYYDDFDKDDNFYRVLFKPGYPVQARELTGLQSILQNQIESFGSHVFKEGSMVIPGGITCDNAFTTVKVNGDHLGIDVTVYLQSLVNANGGKGTRVQGESSDVVGTIKGYLLPPNEGVEEITLFVKYRNGGNADDTVQFENGETLRLLENVTYGNTTLNSGDTILTLVANNAAQTGYSVGVDSGVYFIRGVFVDVQKSQIILDPYNNEPSYRVGFDVVETVVTSDDDVSLNDNARGFTNYAAPGADRLKIGVKLAKKQLSDFDDTNFIELVKIDNGVIKKLQNKSEYNLIKDYFAKRTFEESGSYAVDSFTVDVVESLNNETGNGGLFREDQKTDQGNTPSEDLMCVRVSAGTAYVRGFDVDLVGSTSVDVEKPRSTKKIDGSLVPFSLGSLLKVNNVLGVPYFNIGAPTGSGDNIISLYNRRRNTSVVDAGTGEKIGEARVYWYGVSDAPYENASTEWDLYLFDIQTYTTLYLGKEYSTTEVPLTSYVRGLSSGATGYLSAKPTGSAYSLSQTSGTFLVGEQVIINENPQFKVAIKALNAYSVEDIKSVYQDSNALNTALQSDFIADTVLYERTPPNFSITDKLTINGTTGTVPQRFFNATTGIKTEAIIKYQTAQQTDPNYNRISSIAANGTSIELSGLDSNVSGVARASIDAGDSVFSLMVPKILNLNSSGLYAELPEASISSVDLAQSDLVISKQITGRTTSATGTLTILTSEALDAAAGITSVFFETFDAERYSIHYDDGTTESLTSDQFVLGANGISISFSNLRVSESNVTVIVTLRKKQVTNKSKDFIRSKQISVTRTSGVSTTTGLTTSSYYGLRVEDREISLNVPDVVSIRAIYESTDNSAPTLDKLTFATGLALDANAITGEKIVGTDSRAIAQIVNKTATTIDFVYLNENDFEVGEKVVFKDSGINAIIQEITPGSYVDKTTNYFLDKAHKSQYCDYSRIIRKPGSALPSRQLLVIFDYYKVASGNSGDLFTVDSYTEDRYKNDIPALPNGTRLSDILDFRPRLTEFDSSSATSSPFAFSSRQYESNFRYIVAPGESSYIGYSYYLPRIDLVSLNRLGEVEVIKGEASSNPQAPILADDAMEVAQIRYPAYLYNVTKDPIITLRDNRRFTMRDIAKLEERIENLEEVTSLSLLELSAKTLAVTDANGLDRFKSGFIVSDFKDKSIADPKYTTIDIDKENKNAISPIDFWSMQAELALDPGIDRTTADTSQNLKLLDPNIQKTGDLLTLKYTETDWIEQPHATNVENVNPFNVIVFVGGVTLDPQSDNWTRTIYIDDQRTESTGAKWIQQASVKVDVDSKTEYVTYKKGGGRGERKKRAFTTTTTTTTTSYKPKLTGPSREFDYVENIKISNSVDPYMRSRNVYFAANGLRPFTKHYHYLDSQQVDVVPKICEMNMISGVFRIFEDVDVFYGGKKIGLFRIQKPNHKFGDSTRPDIGAGLGSPALLVEPYTSDPYDRTRPAPGSSYSATSKLINFDVRSIASEEKYYGYAPVGSRIVGRTSGAVARISKSELISDNWGDILACFFFRDPNSSPKPPTRVKSGTKTVRVTSVPPGVTPTPNSNTFASEAIGEYSGSGKILTQETSRVSVRNPPKPAAKKTEVNVQIKAPHRDPLAQTFTVDGKGAFLSSFDLFFASKDDSAKLFVELRTVELGTPTSFLVQDYTQVALNPKDINVSSDATVPTTIKFPSPVFLEAGKEYAIVILSPASDEYEMWTATMGRKTVKTQNLPNVQSVIAAKQYIGGSLFKSQNGTIWTASQYQDLTFKLRKAQFVNSGTLTFYNTDITPKGSNVSILQNNPIEGLPRKLRLPISGTLDSNVVPGTKIGEGSSPSITGIVENLGGPIGVTTIISSGSGYPNGSFTTVELYSLSGKGQGAQATIDFSSGSVSSITITSTGNGYVEGEVLGITTSSISSGSASGGGTGAKFGVQTHGSTDTIYLTNVQGENFTNTSTIQYYTNPNSEASRTTATATVNGTSSLIDSRYTGNIFKVKQYNHAHHGGNNKIEIVDIKPDREKIKLTADFSINDTIVSVANTSVFGTFEGITTSRGYALIENEVVSYSNITAGSGGAGTLTINGRSLNNSLSIPHSKDSIIQPYEVNGVSLMRLNTTHDIPSSYYRTENSNIDNYFLEFSRTSPTARNSGSAMLNFAGEKGFGGDTVGISQNHQFSSVEPIFNVITPGKGTSVNAQIRTISGTSAGGSEVSFIDQGYESVPLNKVLHFNTPRMVASRINENTRLTTLPSNKSLTMRVNFATDDINLSPVMDIQNATFILGRNKTNSPITDYVSDDRSNRIDGDPHAAVFVTKGISLEQPATSLKVIVAANRQEDADFRVFYKLYKADSSEIPQSFVPFPGYDNLLDTDGDGFGDRIIDIDKNSGRADAFVSPNDSFGFSEYQFSANNLDQFDAFAIKIVMSSKNESTPVKLKDFRCIALA
jgi:hypothetical protein